MKNGNRIKHTFRLPPDLSARLADYAARTRVSQAQIVETALGSFLSPDGSERIEAALSSRLDRLSRQANILDYHVEVTNEALALFIRFWLTANPPLPSTAEAAAQAKGKDRYQGFVEALTRKLEFGPRFASIISNETKAQSAPVDPSPTK